MYGEPKDDKPVICYCGHVTTIGECKKVRVSHPFDYTKSGREGYEYHCPKCKRIAHSWYWKVS